MKEHAALVLKNEEKILFIKRSMKKKTLPGIWAFPSGTVEEGEDVYNTIKREAEEELGVEVDCEKVLAETELPEFSVKLVFILCSVKSGEIKINEPDEIDKFEWMGFSDFFNKFSDNQIGHGLIWLRKNPHFWEEIK
jgi:mutator protein MutT